jgi:hypothetical protein
MTKWQRMWERLDSQEVGLEAAILQRKRNSSLVERTRAENSAGLKSRTEATGFLREAVGEHSLCGEGVR